MAKVTAPLFSNSAAGTLGRIIYRNPLSGQTAGLRTFRNPPPPTQAQLDVRQNCRDAAAYWATMTDTERAEWKTRGIITRSTTEDERAINLQHGWALFLKEWVLQQASATNPPMMPI